MRVATFAGLFYEKSFDRLNKQIEDCFKDKKGPGGFPLKRTKKISAIISPHAGYVYSGAAMAHAYKEVAEAEFADTYVIVGTDHTGIGNSVCLDDFETPFGIVKVDKNYCKQLLEKGFRQDKFINEHSIEVQLPFLQFVSKDNLKKLRIVPAVVNSFVEFPKTEKRVIFISSSDFTHYGINYGYTPFLFNKKEQMYDLDSKAIEFIKKLDAKGFLEYVNKTGATICGYNSIASVVNYCKEHGAKKATLLKYYTSGDVVNDYINAVGYAAVSIV